MSETPEAPAAAEATDPDATPLVEAAEAEPETESEA